MFVYILRKTTKTDIQQVMAIINQGKTYLKASGVDQWQNGYPNEAVINEDIANGYGFVLTVDNEIVATVALSFDGEPWYDDIRDGAWLTNDDFLVIHRMAVSEQARGTEVASELLRHAEKLCRNQGVSSIKIDTHPENIPMQKLVSKNGFAYCGIVILGTEGDRLAYEKRLI